MTTGQLRVRMSLHDLQDDYAKGNKKPLEDLMRAWKGIKDLPPENPRSFFALGGLHGEPFRGAGWGSSASVLSRWSVQGCANCQTHLEVQAFMDLHPFQEAALKTASYQVEVHTRDGMLGQVQHSGLAMVQRKLFRVEVR